MTLFFYIKKLKNIMDYSNKYFRKLLKITSFLQEDTRNEIYYDLAKLEIWKLPWIDEIEYFVNSLGEISIREWKFILKEFQNPYHNPIRNERFVEIIKLIRFYNLRIKLHEIYYFYESDFKHEFVSKNSFKCWFRISQRFGKTFILYDRSTKSLLDKFSRKIRVTNNENRSSIEIIHDIIY